ncbi:MAG: hypothetical protein A2150_04390 [Candidatus Muproteobacteria bacterium RBG_16_64_11]|uniref:Uncharacterized protein n=1 Tax=Candidatus Muproteobacteria bacterium RBG_16_64_11 TaxID=1817758 RepID=A0A1F6TE38_9PROT|nr:MAG: hypothetical protein A2150_04390 [Candidatus Muproteobacteria bacterium RBG_16_64_11]
MLDRLIPMLNGLLSLPWWGYVLVALAFAHLTIVSVTIFLHRHQAHRALDLHPIVSHFFRFWLWLTTGMITRDWVAIHRKHHAKVETPEDPHSPQQVGVKKVLWDGISLYRAESKDLETLEKYGHGTPQDWLERKLYVPHTGKGIVLMLLDAASRARLNSALERFQRLHTVYTMKQKLQAIWHRSVATHEHLLHALQEWCREAEATGIQALREFALKLRTYSLAQPTP